MRTKQKHVNWSCVLSKVAVPVFITVLLTVLLTILLTVLLTDQHCVLVRIPQTPMLMCS